jgi:hypothetical protein
VVGNREFRGGLVVVILLLAGCDSGGAAPSGPYASPGPSAPQAVVEHGCASLKAPPSPDVSFARDLLIRQGTLLARVADDLGGTVPGGDLRVDTELTVANARGIADAFQSSTLCADLKDKLVAKSRVLFDADTKLAQVAATAVPSDVPAVLSHARVAYQDLEAQVGASVSPAP